MTVENNKMKIKDQAEEYLNRWDDLQQMNYLKIFLNTYKVIGYHLMKSNIQ